MNVLSLFTGVGGIDLGFEKNKFKIIYQNEFDLNAVKTLQLNFQNTKIDSRDINNIKVSEIPKHDILVGGFPCQPFSIAGKGLGLNDKRSNVINKMFAIIKKNKPKIILLENVKNITSKKHREVFDFIIKKFVENKYYVKYKIMNTNKVTNIPQNRERIFIVAFLSKISYEKFIFPKTTKKLDNYRKYLLKNVNEKYYYTREKNHKIYSYLKREWKKNPDTIYQWRRKYVRSNKKNMFPTLTANMGTGGHNVPIIKDKIGFRKITPRECFLIQGFHKSFKFPKISDGNLYKQAGNAVSVPVIEKIVKEIIKVV